MDRKRSASTSVNSSSNSAATGTVNRPNVAHNNKDSSSFVYDKEKERFLADLRRFHDARGLSTARMPCVGGKSLDLYEFYNAVTHFGGWEKVSNENLWPEVQEHLKLPKYCTNADHGLRQLYIRYLHHYEKINHLGQELDSRNDNDVDDSGRRRFGGPMSLGVSFSYNYQQHSMSEGVREILGLNSKDSMRPSAFVHLERSLLSGLPNEVDFAMNVCLLLSHESKQVLSGSKGSRVIDCILSRIGLLKEGGSLLSSDDVTPRFLRFWNESVGHREVKELVCPECLFFKKGSASKSKDDCSETQDSDDKQCADDDNYWDSSLGRNFGIQDKEGQRVTQVAMILRNMSFDEENLESLTSNVLVIRFLMLCLHNTYGCIRHLAMDTLSNLALKMSLEPSDCQLTQLVVKTVKRFIGSCDRLEVITGLEALSRLCQVDINEDVLCSQLEDSNYEQLVQLLTLHDIPVLVAVLEALLQLSELGSFMCLRISQTTGAVNILVGLLTLEIQSYGPESLAGSKVVEYVHISAVNSSTSDHTMVNSQIATPGTPAGQVMGPPLRPPSHPVPTGVPVNIQQGSQLPSLSNPGASPSCGPFGVPRPPVVMPSASVPFGQMMTVGMPARTPTLQVGPAVGVPILPAGPLPSAPQSSIQRPGLTTVATNFVVGGDTEVIACNWLKAHFDYRAEVRAGISKSELYRRYVGSCSAHGLRNVVNPAMFLSCVRVAFPAAELEQINLDGGTEIIVKGLIPRLNTPPLPVGPGQVLTAGAPVMLRTPVEFVRQPVPPGHSDPSAVHPQTSIQPTVSNQLVSLPPNYPSIHQALLGNIRPHIEPTVHSVEIVGPAVPAGDVTKSVVVSSSSGHVITVHANNFVTAVSAAENVHTNDSESGRTSKIPILSNGTSELNCQSNLQTPHLTGLNVQNSKSSVDNTVASNAVESSVKKSDSTEVCNMEVIASGLHPNAVCKDQASAAELSTKVDSCVKSNINSNSITTTTDASMDKPTGQVPKLANGHGPSLVNGVCSPVPSVTSDDHDSACDVKDSSDVCTSKSAGVNGNLELGNDDSSDTIDCDDVLVKAMICADIIDKGGHPAKLKGEIVQDEDSEMSNDFLTKFLGNAAGSETPVNETDTGYDDEAAAAVADLLNDVGMADEANSAGNGDSQGADGVLQSSVYSAKSGQNPQSTNVEKLPVKEDNLAIPQKTVASQDPAAVSKSQSNADSGALNHPATVVHCAAAEAARLPVTSVQNGIVFQHQLNVALSCAQPVGFHPVVSNAQMSAQLVTGNGPVIPGSRPALVYNNSHPVTKAINSSSDNCNTNASNGSQWSTTLPMIAPAPARQPMQLSAPSSLVPRVILTRADAHLVYQQGQPTLVRSLPPMLAAAGQLGPVQIFNSGQAAPMVLPAGGGAQQLMSGQPMLLNHQGQLLNVQVQTAPGGPLPTVVGAAATQEGDGANRQVALSSQPSQPQPHFIVQTNSAPTGCQQQQPMPVQFAVQTQPGQPLKQLTFNAPMPVLRLQGTLQLPGGGIVGVQTGAVGSNPLIIQRAGQPVFVQTAVGAGGQQQQPQQPNNVVFRMNSPALIATHFTAQNSDVSSPQNLVPIVPNGPAAAPVSESVADNGTSRKRTASVDSSTRSLRKRKKPDEEAAPTKTADVPQFPVTENIVPIPSHVHYICDWTGCQKWFETYKQIYRHVTKEHFENNGSPTHICHWTGCDGLPRQRWSFMTHLQDRHLNENGLRHAVEQKRRQSERGQSATPSATVTANPPPVYPPNAALQAIRRFSARPPFPELMDNAEGPVTKHVRLTSALVLRNLARYSALGRSLLRQHEQMLSYTASSTVEASGAISDCLFELQKH